MIISDILKKRKAAYKILTDGNFKITDEFQEPYSDFSVSSCTADIKQLRERLEAIAETIRTSHQRAQLEVTVKNASQGTKPDPKTKKETKKGKGSRSLEVLDHLIPLCEKAEESKNFSQLTSNMESLGKELYKIGFITFLTSFGATLDHGATMKFLNLCGKNLLKRVKKMKSAKEKGIKLTGEVQKYLKQIEEIANDVKSSEFEATGYLRKINDLVKKSGWIVQASEYMGEISSKKEAIWVPDDLFPSCSWDGLSVKLNEMENIVNNLPLRYGQDFKNTVKYASCAVAFQSTSDAKIELTEGDIERSKHRIKNWLLNKETEKKSRPTKK